jgi:protein-tyrosine-phosphatase
MTDRPYQVLFLSQRNSARSVIAEALLNTMGRGKFIAHSAGVRPAAQVDPMALEVLEHAKIPVTGLRPRHVADFTNDAAEPLDFVFTLSDTAAGEAPPTWPGQPITAHWRSTDPEHSTDSVERRHTLIRVRAELERRLRVFMNLPFASLDRLSAQRHLDDLGSSAMAEFPENATRL